MRLYPKLTDQSGYYHWIEEVVALARAHGVADVVDPAFVAPRHLPIRDFTSPQAVLYEKKNAWVYALLKTIVLTPEGVNFIAEHKHDFDAKRVIEKLINYGSRSTHAVLDNENIITTLSTVMLDRSWNGTALEFITYFVAKVTQYNEQTPNQNAWIREELCSTLLKKAVAQVPILNTVKERDIERSVMNMRPMHFYEYLSALKTQAIVYDEARLQGRHRGVRFGANAT